MATFQQSTEHDTWMAHPSVGVDVSKFAGAETKAGPEVGPGKADGAPASLLAPQSYSGEFTLKERPIKKFKIGQFLDAELKVALAVKFSGAAAVAEGPSKAEIEKDLDGFLASCWNDFIANATSEKGIGIKGDHEKKVSIAASVTLKTKVGLVGLEFMPVEISILNFDPKKGLSGPKVAASVSPNVPLFRRTIRNVELEFTCSGSFGGEITPDYIGIGAWVAENGAEGVISVTIDAVAVAGIPLLAAAIIGQGIYAAGERGKLDAAIFEGAIDAKQAAFDYASTMYGVAGWHKGPRAKAAVAVAMGELAKIATARKVSVEALMKDLKADPNQGADLRKVYLQSDMRLHADYSSEVRGAIQKWRKEHSLLAIWTTEADDCIEADKKVDLIFASDDYLKA